MRSVSIYHSIALEFAFLGIGIRQQGQQERAVAFFEQALDFELAAIAELDGSDRLTWATLHRSAAALALACRQFRQAEQITMRALAGDIHPHIAQELRSLLQQIHFQRHLDSPGVALPDHELGRRGDSPPIGPE